MDIVFEICGSEKLSRLQKDSIHIRDILTLFYLHMKYMYFDISNQNELHFEKMCVLFKTTGGP